MNNSKTPVAPSAIPITNDEVHTPNGKVAHVIPRALHDSEIPGIVEGFRKAATNAKAAGFDGVEVHGANGYLLDEFWRDGSNKRSSPYGGSIENRSKLILEVLEATISVWGSDRVGLRISPLNSYNSMIDSDPVGISVWLARRLNPMRLAYLHVMRADFLGEQKGDVMTPIREAYDGVIIGNMGYTADEAEQAIGAGKLDAVAFGTQFLANPDLPQRFLQGAPLNAPDSKKFYSAGPEGYTGLPILDDQLTASGVVLPSQGLSNRRDDSSRSKLIGKSLVHGVVGCEQSFIGLNRIVRDQVDFDSESFAKLDQLSSMRFRVVDPCQQNDLQPHRCTFL
jgi:N-ethylmaleimide reductase